MMFPKLKLSYFDIPGRAEAIRLALFIGGIPYEDDRFALSEIGKRRSEFPYGVVPVLQVDDQVLAESTAIARYAGRLAGLYPANNPLAAAMVDEIIQVIDEFGESYRPWYSATDPNAKQDEEIKLANEIIPKYLAQIDARLAEMKTHPTFQDDSRLLMHELILYQYLHTMLLVDWLPLVPRDVHKPFKHWVAAELKVVNHPRVREWNALQSVRPRKLKLTYFDASGRAEPIRLAFHLGGIEFEDNRVVDPEVFAQLKPTLPYEALPVLEVDETATIAQSYAILRYAGSLSDLYPVSSQHVLALRIDDVLSVLDQLPTCWGPAFATEDLHKQRVLRDKLVKETILKCLGALNQRIRRWAMPYATGSKLTIADLGIFGIVDFFKSSSHLPASIVEDFPALLNIHALVRGEPTIAAYLTGRN